MPNEVDGDPMSFIIRMGKEYLNSDKKLGDKSALDFEKKREKSLKN